MSGSELKKEMARRQLGTALALFLVDDDPVSVHCLACGGGEIADSLAKEAGEKAFSQHALDVHPEMQPTDLANLRNKYWNAMKHSRRHDGKAREDDDLLANFDDSQNEHYLYIGWHDYASAVGSLPIEAQVFQVWYFAKFPEKLSADFSPDYFERQFPNIQLMKRNDQKKFLRRRIVWARKNADVMRHPRTDRRKLILGII